MLMRYLDNPKPLANELPFLGLPSCKRYLTAGSPHLVHIHYQINQYEGSVSENCLTKNPHGGLSLKEPHLKLLRKAFSSPARQHSLSIRPGSTGPGLRLPFLVLCVDALRGSKDLVPHPWPHVPDSQ